MTPGPDPTRRETLAPRPPLRVDDPLCIDRDVSGQWNPD